MSQVGFQVIGSLIAVEVATAGAGSMNGFCALLKKEIVKWIFAVIKRRFLQGASFSFVDRFILDDSFLFWFARIRYDLPECSVQCLAFGPNLVCCPESGETEIMSNLWYIFCVNISKQLNQLVW